MTVFLPRLTLHTARAVGFWVIERACHGDAHRHGRGSTSASTHPFTGGFSRGFSIT